MNKNLIENNELLFRYSGLIDSLRDSLKVLSENGGVDEMTLKAITGRYNLLIETVKPTLVSSIHSEFDIISPIITGDTTLEYLYLHTTQLSGYLELLHQTPDFLMSQKVREVNANQLNTQLTQAENTTFNRDRVLHFGMQN